MSDIINMNCMAVIAFTLCIDVPRDICLDKSYKWGTWGFH